MLKIRAGPQLLDVNLKSDLRKSKKLWSCGEIKFRWHHVLLFHSPRLTVDLFCAFIILLYSWQNRTQQSVSQQWSHNGEDLRSCKPQKTTSMSRSRYVMCCWWGWAVVAWTCRDVKVLEKNKSFLGCLFFFHPGERETWSQHDCSPVLIGFFLSVHLILDPLQHLLHPPQLWPERRDKC